MKSLAEILYAAYADEKDWATAGQPRYVQSRPWGDLDIIERRGWLAAAEAAENTLAAVNVDA